MFLLALQIYGQLFLNKGFIIILTVIAIIIALMIGAYSGLNISRILIELAKEAKHFGQGNFELKREIYTNDEIGMLYRTLQKMAKKIQRQISFLSGIVQISKSLNSTLEIKKIESEASKKIINVFNAKAVTILLYNETTKLLETDYVYTVNGYQQLRKYFSSYRVKPPKGPAGKAFLKKKSAIIKDTETPKDLGIFFKVGIRTNAWIPLLVKSKAIGVICISFGKVIDAEESKLICTYASHVATALANAGLYISLQKKVKKSNTIIKLSKSMISSLNLNQVLKIIIDQLCMVLESQNGCIALFDGKNITKIACHGDSLNDDISLSSVVNLPGARRAISLKKPALVKSPIVIPKELKTPFKEAFYQSYMIIPLLSRQKNIGFIWLASTKDTFSDEDKEFAGKLGNQATIAIDNAGLYESVEDQAEKLVILHGISLKLNKQLDSNKILRMVLKGACQLTNCKFGKVGNLDNNLVYDAIFKNNSKKEIIIRKGKSESNDIISDLNNLVNKKRLTVLKSTQFKDFAKLKFDIPENIIAAPIVNSYYGINCFLILGKKTPFSEIDLAICEILAAHATVALINAKNYNTEHEIAHTLQSSLLPTAPTVDELDIDFVYQTATSGAMVGGDFLDFLNVGQGRMGLIIGDVSGKGIEAATMTAKIKNTIRAFAFENPSTAAVLTRANHALSTQEKSGAFVTLLYGLLDLSNGSFVYSNAGHHPPIIYRAKSREVIKLKNGSTPLGILSSEIYCENNISLDKNDLILFYTDGLVEARNEKGFYGDKRLEQNLRRMGNKHTKDIVDFLLKDVEDYCSGNLHDDIALFALRIKDLKAIGKKIGLVKIKQIQKTA